MNICIFSNLFPPIQTGSSIFTWEFSRKMAQRGHRISVITAQLGHDAAYEEKDGVRVHRIPSIRLPPTPLTHNFKWMSVTFTPGNLRKVHELFTREKFDIIHQQNHIFDTILTSPRMAKRFALPLILTIHTCVQHPNPYFNRILILFDALARQVILSKADKIVAPDPITREYLRSRHGIQDNVLIPYGIEIDPPQPADVAELRSKYNLDGKLTILSLGHVNTLRNRMDLIASMPRIIQQFPDARLVIVGEVMTQEPVKMVRELGLQDFVTFTGAVPHKQIAAFTALSVLEAHTFQGTFVGPGVASMEAMAAGLPVVTGEVPPPYDVPHLQDWENVVFISPKDPNAMGDAILRLLQDEALRHKIGENACQTLAQYYSWESVCCQYEALYEQSIRDGAEGAR